MTEKPPGDAPEAIPKVGPQSSDSPPVPPAGRTEATSDLDDTVVEKTVHALEKLGLEFAVPTNPKLEKMGLERFAKHDAKYPPLSGTEVVHLLDEDEREKIRRLGRNMVLWAFMVGGFSGLISSIASFIMHVPAETPTTFGYDVLEFAIVNAVTIGITAVEVAILYRKALQTVHLIAREAGIQLVPRSDRPETDEQRAVALALARSALELPNPPQNPFGINPYKEISKWRLVLTTILYKLKISLTNFILRLLIRRVGGRVIVKAYLTFTDVFVTGAWDALVAWRMVRQARIRALGPSACETLLRAILKDQGVVRREVFTTMLRAVAVNVVRNHEVHPNLLALMRSIVRRIGAIEVKGLDDMPELLAALDRLTEAERELVFEVFVLASFPDGTVSRAERKLLQTVLGRYGRTLSLTALRRVRRRFERGDAVARSHLRATLSTAA